MTPEAYFAGVAVLFSIGGPLVAYGALRQKVNDLDKRVGSCEGRHEATADEIGNMRETMARLDERSNTMVKSLDRIEGKLDAKETAVRRARRAPA